MAVYQQHFIYVPKDERHASTWLHSLVEEWPDFAEQVAVLQASTGSAIATLEGLVAAGTFRRIEEVDGEEAWYIEAEARASGAQA